MTIIRLDKVRKNEARAFGAFLMGKAAGAGVPETPPEDKAGLGRDAEGRVVAQYKNHILARGTFDRTSGQPAVEIMPITPQKHHEAVIGLFDKAYKAWHEHANAALSAQIKEKMNVLLDPPKNGAPEVTLESVTRSDIEELSLKDVLQNILPAGVELVKFDRNDQRIRVSYAFSETGIQVPLLSAWNADKKTVLRSGDGISPAPVAFFSNLLDEAKAYNKQVSGPPRLKKIMKDFAEDLSDKDVEAALAQHLASSDRTIELALTPEVQMALVPKTGSAYVYIDRKMIAQAKPESGEKMWVRPGYGWSVRSEFAQRAIVEGGRRMIAEKLLDAGPGKDWEEGLGAELG